MYAAWIAFSFSSREGHIPLASWVSEGGEDGDSQMTIGGYVLVWVVGGC